MSSVFGGFGEAGTFIVGLCTLGYVRLGGMGTILVVIWGFFLFFLWRCVAVLGVWGVGLHLGPSFFGPPFFVVTVGCTGCVALAARQGFRQGREADAGVGAFGGGDGSLPLLG